MIKVSVVVITYNFEKYILETLNSIKDQTYKNIELIISDDNSNDNTKFIVEKWIEKNKEEFREIIFLKNSINQGVTKNINIGVRRSTGEWVKIIAGDDILEKNAISNYIESIKNNKLINIVFGQAQSFNDTFNKSNFGKVLPAKDEEKFFFKTIEQQKKWLLKGNPIPAPTSFIRRKLLEKNNYFDERFKMVEDYPFWFKIVNGGEKIYYLKKITVFYRKISTSVSAKKNGEEISKAMFEFDKKFYYEELSKNLKSIFYKWDKNIEFLIKNLILKNNNKKLPFYKKRMLNLLFFKNLLVILLLIIGYFVYKKLVS